MVRRKIQRGRGRLKSKGPGGGRKGVAGLRLRAMLRVGACILIVVVFGAMLRLGHAYLQKNQVTGKPFRVGLLQTGEVSQAEMMVLEYFSGEVREARMVYIPAQVTARFGPLGGEYRLETFPRIVDMERLKQVELSWAVTWALGRHVDAVLLTEKPWMKGDRGGEMRQVAKRIVTAGVRGEMNTYDALLVGWQLYQMEPRSVSVIDLSGKQAYMRTMDVDGQEILRFNEALMDQLWQPMGRAASSTTVINGTGVPGWARLWARILSHEGMDVVRETTAEEEYGESRIVVGGSDKEEMKRLEIVARMLGLGQVSEDEEAAGEQRSEVVVVLGKDLLGK